jgi:hypothetical protein
MRDAGRAILKAIAGKSYVVAVVLHNGMIIGQMGTKLIVCCLFIMLNSEGVSFANITSSLCKRPGYVRETTMYVSYIVSMKNVVLLFCIARC